MPGGGVVSGCDGWDRTCPGCPVCGRGAHGLPSTPRDLVQVNRARDEALTRICRDADEAERDVDERTPAW